MSYQQASDHNHSKSITLRASSRLLVMYFSAPLTLIGVSIVGSPQTCDGFVRNAAVVGGLDEGAFEAIVSFVWLEFE